jgi:methylmalonyl-CoA/ethylmalonyl-CoA epimerase
MHSCVISLGQLLTEGSDPLLKRIDHLGIAVNSIQSALEFYQAALGLDAVAVEDVAGQKTRVALLPIGESRIELLEPLSTDSPVAKFLQKRGEGLHHICFSVDDIEAVMAKLRSAGVRILNEEPLAGAGGSRVAFIHPSSGRGVLIELSQPPGSEVNNPME